MSRKQKYRPLRLYIYSSKGVRCDARKISCLVHSLPHDLEILARYHSYIKNKLNQYPPFIIRIGEEDFRALAQSVERVRIENVSRLRYNLFVESRQGFHIGYILPENQSISTKNEEE